MTHEELIDAITRQIVIAPPFVLGGYPRFLYGLRAVVELHKPFTVRDQVMCEGWCASAYPCPTIKAIEEALQ